jgi:two-component system CheB/CheR fusion protein
MPHHSRRTVSLQASSEPQRESQLVRTTDESLLNQLPVGVIVVDRRYHIQAINTAARQLLFIRGAAIGEDLLHLMQEVPYTEVREAIDAAFRDGEFAGTGEFVVEEVATGDICYLQLVCQPERTEGEWRPAERVMIVVNDVTEPARARRELEKQVEGTKAEFERFRHEAEAEAAHQETQNARLIETNRRLEEANRELTEFNQELQSSYEESLVSTEEAQAATEEVETLNEELQATNEELETLNEELQATIEELNTTNDDLQARTQELQELAQTREEERQTSETSRQRLETILQSMSDAVLAVNAEGKMLFSDETFKELFGEVSGADTGYLGGFALLDENGERLPPEATPQARAARGESFVMRFVAEEDGGARRLFEAKGKRIGGENEVGGVIVFREVTEGSG